MCSLPLHLIGSSAVQSRPSNPVQFGPIQSSFVSLLHYQGEHEQRGNNNGTTKEKKRKEKNKTAFGEERAVGWFFTRLARWLIGLTSDGIETTDRPLGWVDGEISGARAGEGLGAGGRNTGISRSLHICVRSAWEHQTRGCCCRYINDFSWPFSPKGFPLPLFIQPGGASTVPRPLQYPTPPPHPK